jgi:hypothetical protein
MSTPADSEVPEGSAVFPLVPPELGIDPLLLATLHAVVFLNGSDERVVHPAAAEEALDFMLHYLERLNGARLAKVREDLDCLIRLARQEKWGPDAIKAVQAFAEVCGAPRNTS